MEKEQYKTIPYFVHEGMMSRMERSNRRICIALIISLIITFATNTIWLYVFNQYDFETYEYSQDGRGINIIGDENGVDYNGSEIEGSQGDSEKEIER